MVGLLMVRWQLVIPVPLIRYFGFAQMVLPTLSPGLVCPELPSLDPLADFR